MLSMQGKCEASKEQNSGSDALEGIVKLVCYMELHIWACKKFIFQISFIELIPGVNLPLTAFHMIFL